MLEISSVLHHRWRGDCNQEASSSETGKPGRASSDIIVGARKCLEFGERINVAINGRKRAYLAEMGIDVWERRGLGSAAAESGASEDKAVAEDTSEVAREAASVAVARPVAVGAGDHSARVAAMDWDDLTQAVSVCTRCALHEGRTQTVFGVGYDQGVAGELGWGDFVD